MKKGGRPAHGRRQLSSRKNGGEATVFKVETQPPAGS